MAIPYESSLKIIIPFKLPEFLAGGTDLMASAFRTVREEYKFKKVDSAEKRFPVNSVLSRPSNYIVGTNEQIESYLNIVSYRSSFYIYINRWPNNVKAFV